MAQNKSFSRTLGRLSPGALKCCAGPFAGWLLNADAGAFRLGPWAIKYPTIKTFCSTPCLLVAWMLDAVGCLLRCCVSFLVYWIWIWNLEEGILKVVASGVCGVILHFHRCWLPTGGTCVSSRRRICMLCLHRDFIIFYVCKKLCVCLMLSAA